MDTNFLNTPDTTAEFDQQDIESNKIMAVLSYLGILWLIPMLAAKESKFAQYHVNQGIILTIAGIAVSVACFIIAWIPILGWIIAPIAGLIPLPCRFWALSMHVRVLPRNCPSLVNIV